MKKSLFNTAATCFGEAGEFEMEKIAKCHQKALDASKYVQKSILVILNLLRFFERSFYKS